MQVGDVFLQVFQRVLDLQRKQAAQTGAVLGGGNLWLVEHLNGDGVPLINERWKADQRLSAFLDFQQLGQFAKGPRRVALLGDGRLR